MKWAIDEQESENKTKIFVVELVSIKGFGVWDIPIAHVIEPQHAELIVAAPELVATLKQIVETQSDKETPAEVKLRYCVRLAEIAIAKAKGEEV